MVILDRVYPECNLYGGTRSSYLYFGFSTVNYTSYIVEKYHIYDSSTWNITIPDITHLSEINSKDISELELGVDTNSINFITNQPNCVLRRKVKPKFNSENIFFIPSGKSVRTKRYHSSNKKTFTWWDRRVCQLYLPSSLFTSIEQIEELTLRYPFYKTIEKQFLLKYKDLIFKVRSDIKEIHQDKNKKFLKELNNISGFEPYEEPILTNELKNKVINRMSKFIEKYEKFNVEI